MRCHRSLIRRGDPGQETLRQAPRRKAPGRTSQPKAARHSRRRKVASGSGASRVWRRKNGRYHSGVPDVAAVVGARFEHHARLRWRLIIGYACHRGIDQPFESLIVVVGLRSEVLRKDDTDRAIKSNSAPRSKLRGMQGAGHSTSNSNKFICL